MTSECLAEDAPRGKRQRGRVQNFVQNDEASDSSVAENSGSEYCDEGAPEEPDDPIENPKVRPRKRQKTEKADVQELKDRIQALKSEKQDLIVANATLHNTCMDLVSRMESKHPKMDDEMIRNRVFDFQRECQDWVKDFSVSKKLADIPENNAKALLSYPQSIRAQGKLGRLRVLLVDLQCSIPLVLHRALSRFICRRIIEQPILCFRKVPPLLDRMFKHLHQTGNDRFGEWVGDTIDAMESCRSKDQTACPAVPPKSRDCKICAFAIEFLRDLPQVALKELGEVETTRRLKELSYVMHNAGELTLLLWRQRIDVECLYDDTQLRSEDSKYGPPFVKRYNKWPTLAEDMSLCKQSIALVVDTAIIGHTLDGKRKVWSVATVICDNRESEKGCARPVEQVVSEGKGGQSTVATDEHNKLEDVSSQSQPPRAVALNKENEDDEIANSPATIPRTTKIQSTNKYSHGSDPFKPRTSNTPKDTIPPEFHEMHGGKHDKRRAVYEDTRPQNDDHSQLVEKIDMSQPTSETIANSPYAGFWNEMMTLGVTDGVSYNRVTSGGNGIQEAHGITNRAVRGENATIRVDSPSFKGEDDDKVVLVGNVRRQSPCSWSNDTENGPTPSPATFPSYWARK